MIHHFHFKPGEESEIVTTREGYDRWAEIYDDEDNPLIALEEEHLSPLLGDVRGLDVLELGSGTGRRTLWFCENGARVTAVDFSDGMIEKARRKPGWEHVRFVPHDLARPLPFDDGYFDMVAHFLVGEHIPDLHRFFRECRRVCRTGGRVVASMMHPAMLLRGIHAHFRDPASGRDVCPRSHAHDTSDYVMAALTAGLAIEHMSEHAVGEAQARASQRAAKYLGWPMLLLLILTRV